MNFKVLAFGALLGFAAAFAPSCGGNKCSTATCRGCCASDGKCVADPDNKSNGSCGTQGNACVDCGLENKVCNQSTFQCGITGPGGTDAGTGCDGCRLPGGTCLSLTSTTNCGSNGSACVACKTGEYCTNGVCGAPANSGEVGAACVADTDCKSVPVEAGLVAYCKKQTEPGKVPYRDGYCTRRCLGNNVCGGGSNFCAFGLGGRGEVENICIKGCQSQADCRTAGSAYACINFGGVGGCWLLQADGGLPGVYDAGPAFTGAAGDACTTDSQCGGSNNESLFCQPQTLADGGITGYPGGVCSGDCSIALRDGFCGAGGLCLATPYPVNDGHGDILLFSCERECDLDAGVTPRADAGTATDAGAGVVDAGGADAGEPGDAGEAGDAGAPVDAGSFDGGTPVDAGSSADAGTGAVDAGPARLAPCRPDYVCVRATASRGVCIPDCRTNPTLICGTRACNMNTGLCQQ